MSLQTLLIKNASDNDIFMERGEFQSPRNIQTISVSPIMETNENEQLIFKGTNHKETTMKGITMKGTTMKGTTMKGITMKGTHLTVKTSKQTIYQESILVDEYDDNN
jgi:hypothetical protein